MARSSEVLGSHDCAAPGCGRDVPVGKLMCGPHWFSLPKSLQQEVYKAWRAYNRARPERVHEWIDAHEAYVHARARAVEYVAGGAVVGES